MLISYTTNKFPEDYVPTIFDNYTAEISVDNNSYILNLFDTAGKNATKITERYVNLLYDKNYYKKNVGQEEYDQLRPLSYPQTDLFIVAFSVTSPASYENVKFKWIPEIKRCAPGVPFILVGTKIDMRDGNKNVSKANGERLCHDLNGQSYLECSSKTREGLKDVFDIAINTVVLLRKKSMAKVKKRRCIIS